MTLKREDAGIDRILSNQAINNIIYDLAMYKQSAFLLNKISKFNLVKSKYERNVSLHQKNKRKKDKFFLFKKQLLKIIDNENNLKILIDNKEIDRKLKETNFSLLSTRYFPLKEKRKYYKFLNKFHGREIVIEKLKI